MQCRSGQKLVLVYASDFTWINMQSRRLAGWQLPGGRAANRRQCQHGVRCVCGSLQLLPIFGSFSLYLDVQYFTGCGESLLSYNKRSDALRAGISLYR